ncbi:MAG TPA: hypothetical protein ENH33_00585 [Actinobacteria bacterium]|nr:hypothetical protein [Actinomycetota bacterium]
MIIEELQSPIKHDGWSSRTFLSCAIAFLLLLGIFTALFVWTAKLAAVQYLYAIGLDVALLLIGLGLVKVDKVLELIKLKMLGKGGA